MECDCLITLLAFSLQLAGWLSLVPTKLMRSPRVAVVGHVLLLGILLGLGLITLVAASMRISCALSAGGTATVLMLATIALSGQERSVDPYQQV